MKIISRFMKSRWWHLFAAFYMLATIAYIIYTVVAYAVGWFGASATLGQGLIIAAIQLAVAFIIWFCFMRYYRREARQMNEKIQALKK